MILEAGKNYLTRSGLIITLKVSNVHSDLLDSGWYFYDPSDKESGHLVFEPGNEHPHDIIEQVQS